MASAAGLLPLLPVLSVIFSICFGVRSPRDPVVLCNDKGCYVMYFLRRTFLESWKSCRGKGGNLATLKHPEEAAQVRELFSDVELWGQQEHLRVWIGLQRQPRQCSATQPLRGFAWTTGDQDTEYTNWLKEDSYDSCSISRCVVISYSIRSEEQHRNFKWIDASCSLPVEGFLCHYSYKGMCPGLKAEEAGPPVYSMPFQLKTTLLAHVPIGSQASVPCPDGTKANQVVFCMLKGDGNINWSRNGPYCSNDPPDRCKEDNGGCQHSCYNTGTHYYCECEEGYKLAEDEKSCFAVDPCQTNPCQFQCMSGPEGYHCVCPEGYLLASDSHSCVDEDECLQRPCQQLCVNLPGTFECRCLEGYRQDEFGYCADVDECLSEPCEHACENTLGSYICHCRVGFSPRLHDNSRCEDVDECQMLDICQQKCVNYDGGFECRCEEGYILQLDNYSCEPNRENQELSSTVPPFFQSATSPPSLLSQAPDFDWPQLPVSDWETDRTPLPWLTKLPSMNWSTDAAQEEPTTILPSHLFPGESTTDKTASDRSNEADTLMFSSTPSPTIDTYWYEDESTETTLVFSPTSPAKVNHSNHLNSPTQHHLYTSVDLQGGNKNPAVMPKEVVPSKKGSSSTPDQTPAFTTPSLPNKKNQRPKTSDNKWLLLGLIIPFAIVLLVLVFLCIRYRRRSAAKARSKNTEDCYYWISRSGAKVESENSGKSVV